MMRVGKVRAHRLKVGRCFKYGKFIYMRDSGYMSAVRLTGSRPGGIINCEQRSVTPVKVKIVEEK